MKTLETNKKRMKHLGATIAVGLATAGLSQGCGDDGAIESLNEAGEDLGHSIDELGDDLFQRDSGPGAIEEVGDEIGEAGRAAKDEIDDAARKVRDSID